jgi:hypothetical protein
MKFLDFPSSYVIAMSNSKFLVGDASVLINRHEVIALPNGINRQNIQSLSFEEVEVLTFSP